MDANRDYLYRGHSEVIRALWCVNSENGEQVLVNLDTNEIMLRRVGGVLLPPFEKEQQ